MAATARVVVLFDDAEKVSLQMHAVAARLSMGEYIKRAVTAYDIEADGDTAAELEALAGQLSAAAVQMNAQLDSSIARIDRLLDPAREAEQRARIEREVRGMPLNGLAEALGLSA